MKPTAGAEQPSFPRSLNSPGQVSRFLVAAGIPPLRSLGQNFLTDSNILRLIIDAADLETDACVLEIGAGLGVVTEPLCRRAGKVYAIEKDMRLYELLAARFGECSNLELINADATRLELNHWVRERRIGRVVSNLPYSVGSRLLVDLCFPRPFVDVIVVTVQKEVAVRMAADAGSREYGLLSVLLQTGYEVKLIRNVSATCFWPRPEVASAIVKLTRRGGRVLSVEQALCLRDLLQYAFSRRRKKIGPTFRQWCGKTAGLDANACDAVLAQCEISPDLRPEGLTPEKWHRIVRCISGLLASDNSAG